MTLTQLRALVTAAELGSFTAAAERLAMSQPAISDLVRRLEDELGTELFHRGSRRLRLTEAGRQLRPHAERSLAAAAAGTKAVRSQMDLEGGTATFGLLRNADFYIRANLVARFRAMHPQVRIRFVGQNSAETTKLVATGRVEAGLITLPVPDEADLDIVPVARDEVLYVSAAPFRRRRAAITDLARDDLVLYDAHYADTDPARRQLSDRAQVAGVSLDPVIEVEYLATALSLTAAGLGNTIACRAALTATAAAKKLHAVPFADPMFDTLAFVKRRNQDLSPATREMARLAWDALSDNLSSPKGTATLIADQSALEDFLGSPLRPSSPRRRP